MRTLANWSLPIEVDSIIQAVLSVLQNYLVVGKFCTVTATKIRTRELL
jgi:hypothetical protein